MVPKPPAPVPGGVQWLSFGIVDLMENVLGSFYSRTDKLLESARTRRAFIQELLAQHQGSDFYLYYTYAVLIQTYSYRLLILI